MVDTANIFAPKVQSLRLGNRTSESEKMEPLLSEDFLLCFFSFMMLTFSYLWGTIPLLGFLVPWAFVVFRNFQKAKIVLRKNWILFLFGVLGGVSMIWSTDPVSSVKGGIEFIATTAIGILAGSCIRPRAFIAALLYTYIVGGILSLLIGNSEIIYNTQEEAWAGIYLSKNNFSTVMSILLLAALSILSDRLQPPISRIISFFTAFFFAPYMLYHGKSLDSMVAVVFAPALLMLVIYLRGFHSTIRKVILAFSVIFIILAVLFFSVSEINPLNGLHAVGKDATLTGRTWIWAHAFSFIDQHLILGGGFQAFWKLWNPRALEIWYGMHLPSGSPIGFHNEYISVMVDLGLVGLFAAISYLFIVTRRVSKKIFNPMSNEQKFAFMLFTFLLIRTPIEVGIFEPFFMGMILLCMTWIYFAPSDVRKSSPVHSTLAKFKNLNAQAVNP